MRGTKDMDYVWCPLREEGLFNFTDDQLVAVVHLQKLLENYFFVVGFAVFSSGLSFSKCLTQRQRRLELPPLFALMDEKLQTRIRLDTSTLRALKSGSFGTKKPSMAVYTACVMHGRVFRVVRCCKYRRGLGSNVLNMPCKPGVCKAMQEGQCEDL